MIGARESSIGHAIQHVGNAHPCAPGHRRALFETGDRVSLDRFRISRVIGHQRGQEPSDLRGHSVRHVRIGFNVGDSSFRSFLEIRERRMVPHRETRPAHDRVIRVRRMEERAVTHHKVSGAERHIDLPLCVIKRGASVLPVRTTRSEALYPRRYPSRLVRIVKWEDSEWMSIVVANLPPTSSG